MKQTCVYCSTEFSTVTVNFVDVDGEEYCEGCYRENFFECDGCSEHVSLDRECSTHDGSNYCESCFSDCCFQCYNCDLSFDTSDSHRCNNDEIYCRECYENDECDCDNTSWDGSFLDGKNGSFLDGKKCKAMPFKDFVGVEIECTVNDNNELGYDIERKYCEVSDDGSVSGDGDSCEVKTTPSSGDELVKTIKYVTTQIRRHGGEVNESCGLHIHMDCRDLIGHPYRLGRIMKTYYAFEDVLYSMVPKHRWVNSYCHPLHDKYDSKDMSAKTYEKFKTKYYKSSRYYSYNRQALDAHSTIEVRFHSGTINADKILNWIYINLTMKKWALSRFNQEKIDRANNMKMSKAKIDLFFDTFNFDKDHKKYILGRIGQFNPKSLDPNQTNYWQARYELSDINKKVEKTANSYDRIRNSITPTTGITKKGLRQLSFYQKRLNKFCTLRSDLEKKAVI